MKTLQTGSKTNHSCGATLVRRSVIIGLFTALASATARVPNASKPSPKILFICQFGTAKSAIAREVFRQRARKRGINVSAFSRGITPEEHVSPALKARLEGEGIDSTRDGLRKLSRQDIKAADIVIMFNPLPETMRPKDLRDWSAVPSVNDDYPAARADLRRRIDALLDTLAK